jgi:hypothetical protein
VAGIIIIYFTFFSFFFIFKNEQSKGVSYFILISLIIISSLKTQYDSRDYLNYVYAFKNINSLNFNYKYEPTFIMIINLIKTFSNNPVILFIIYSIIGVGLKFKAIFEYSNFILGSIIVYISNFFILHEFTQIRVGVASAFILLSYKYLINKKYYKYIIFILVAFIFHYTAILFLPILFLNIKSINKSNWFLILFFSFILVLNGFTFSYLIKYFSFGPLLLIFNFHESQNNIILVNYVNIFNVIFIVRIFIALYLLYNIDFIYKINPYSILYIKIYIIGLTSFLLFSDITALSFRISDLFFVVEIFLFPMLIYLFKPIKISKIIFIGIIVIFIYINLFYTKLLF